MKKKTDAIEIKDKSCKKRLSLLSKSIWLIVLVVVKILENRTKTKYSK